MFDLIDSLRDDGGLNTTDVDDDANEGTVTDGYNLGMMGIINLGILTIFTLVRTIMYIYRAPEWKSGLFWKRVLFHILLLASVMTDLPMYVSFIRSNCYEVRTYAYHKLESTFQFAAYSITISDWTSVLYILKEESSFPFLFKKTTLIVINVVVSTISVLNFLSLYQRGQSLDNYVEDPIYTIGIVSQFVSGIMLTCVMLHGGLKLSSRLRGASATGKSNGVCTSYLLGLTELCAVVKSTICCSDLTAPMTEANLQRHSNPENNNDIYGQYQQQMSRDSISENVEDDPSSTRVRHQPISIDEEADWGETPSPRSPVRSDNYRGTNGEKSPQTLGGRSSIQFAKALNTLNLVMLICASTIFIQLTLSMLNFLLGYANSSAKSVGPTLLYWIFYAWVPLWGTNCSLLYLVRSNVEGPNEPLRKTKKMKNKKSKKNINKYNAAEGSVRASSIMNKIMCVFGVISSPRNQLTQDLLKDENLSDSDNDDDNSDYSDHSEGSQEKRNDVCNARRNMKPGQQIPNLDHETETATSHDSGASSASSMHSYLSHNSNSYTGSRLPYSSKDMVFFRDVDTKQHSYSQPDYTYQE